MIIGLDQYICGMYLMLIIIKTLSVLPRMKHTSRKWVSQTESFNYESTVVILDQKHSISLDIFVFWTRWGISWSSHYSMCLGNEELRSLVVVMCRVQTLPLISLSLSISLSLYPCLLNIQGTTDMPVSLWIVGQNCRQPRNSPTC